jgi:ribosomal protein S18 acetylase RimI-like enzyme
MQFGEIRPQDMQDAMTLVASAAADGASPQDAPLVLALAAREDSNAPIVGVILVHHDPARGYINTLGIDPQHREGDLAQQLVSKALGKLYSRGVRCCHVSADGASGEGFWDLARWHTATPKAG